MVLKGLITFLFITAFVPWSHALADDFVLGSKKFSVNVPKSWIAKKGIFGLPLVVLGPLQADKTRPVVSFTGPEKGTTSADLTPKLVDALKIKLKTSRQEWAKKNKYKIVDFLPSEFKDIPNGKRLSFGLRYTRDGKRKTELSYYLTCKGQFVMSKIMMTAQNEGFLPIAESVVESLTCK